MPPAVFQTFHLWSLPSLSSLHPSYLSYHSPSCTWRRSTYITFFPNFPEAFSFFLTISISLHNTLPLFPFPCPFPFFHFYILPWLTTSLIKSILVSYKPVPMQLEPPLPPQPSWGLLWSPLLFFLSLSDSCCHSFLFPEAPKSLHPLIQTLPSISLKKKIEKRRNSIDLPHLPPFIPCPFTLSNNMDKKPVIPSLHLGTTSHGYLPSTFLLFLLEYQLFLTVSLSTGLFPTVYRLILTIKTVGLHFSL